MANLDYNIMSGLRPIQLESPQNQLMQAYQLKGAQEASQMNALKMQEMQRGVEQKNRMRAALSGADINSPEVNKLIEQTYLQEGDLGGLIAHRKSMAEMNKAQIGAQYEASRARKEEAEALDKEEAPFRSYASRAATEQDVANYVKVKYKHPTLGPLANKFMPYEQALQANLDAFRRNPTEWRLKAENVSGDKILTAMTTLDQSRYSEYVRKELAAGNNNPLSFDKFKETYQPPAPITGAAPVTRTAPVEITPNQAATLFAGENMPARGEISATPPAPEVVTNAAPVPINGILPNIDPAIAAMIRPGTTEADKRAAEIMQRNIELKNKPEALTELGKLQRERSALAIRLAKATDPAEKKQIKADIRDYDRNINKQINTAAALAPVVPSAPSLSQNAIDDQANRFLLDGTLPSLGMGKEAAANRNAIINRAADLGRQQGVPTDRITQLQNKANSSALTQLTKQETMVGAFEKNFVKNADLVLKFSSKVDRAGAPLLDKWIQSGKRAATGDPELKALDVAIKAVSNEYAKIVSGSMGNTAVAVSEIKRMESLLNSAMTREDVIAAINTMKTETENRMLGFKEQKAELTNSMRGGAGTSVVNPAGRKPLGDILK